jgi:hypothetical protein
VPATEAEKNEKRDDDKAQWRGAISGRDKMNCAEFQRGLPYIIDGNGSAEEEEHLRTCKVCADLVQDLRYIAEQAKLLVPMEEPSPRVWNGISKTLEREGLVKPAPARRGLLGPQRQSWGWMIPVAAVLALAFGISLWRQHKTHNVAALEMSTQAAPAATTDDNEDQQVLEQLAQVQPSLRPDFEQNLRTVNAYIHDAKATLQENPDDNEAKQYLMQAYEQKAMLYDMAARAGE